MKSREEIKRIAIQVIEDEKKAVDHLGNYIDDAFAEAVETIFFATGHDQKEANHSQGGRVVVTGIGKSANIATKIVSTLNSTGTPALFLHAADAIHGDLGMVRPGDVVVCLSKSGNTPEIKVLVPLLKNFGNRLIAIVGNTDSFLAHEADIVLNTTVEHEACPNNLAPTSSTTAQLVMGDALAVALIECRNFTARDFARFHPGGALGKQLYLHVADLYVQNERPSVSPAASIADTILEMTSKRLGCTVVEEEGRICGIVTDGDLRRMMQNSVQSSEFKVQLSSTSMAATQHNTDHLTLTTARDIMNPNPKCILDSEYAVTALQMMRSNSITQLVVVDSDDRYLGIIHIHDILREGII